MTRAWLYATLSMLGCGGGAAVVDASASTVDSTGSAIDATPAPDAAACAGLAMGPTGVLTAQSITVRNATRTYVLSVPATASIDAALPIVFAFHGDGGTGAGIRSSLGLEAPAAGGAIFVYPDGISRADGWWDLEGLPAANDDIALFDALVTEIEAHYCVDPHRIFATGFSRGGFFVNHLACERGDVLRAIAPQSGGGPYWGDYNGDGRLVCPTPPVPALVIHGNADNVVHNDPNPATLEGGWQAFEHWVYWNSPAPHSGVTFATSPSLPSPCVISQETPADHPVIACFIDGLGHAPWSEQATTVWNFFAAR
ncbi:MAG: hypothetical protein K8W52_45625 [Deltaproteobacteria bacterium]|nr:hypothetical protein [Deltaproteobacteria bacterium]